MSFEEPTRDPDVWSAPPPRDPAVWDPPTNVDYTRQVNPVRGGGRKSDASNTKRGSGPSAGRNNKAASAPSATAKRGTKKEDRPVKGKPDTGRKGKTKVKSD